MTASKTIVLAIGLALAVSTLAGCGRNGEPYVPGVYDKNGKPVKTTKQPPVKDRHFVLDPLIQ